MEAGAAVSGLRLDKALAETFADLSRSRIHALIAEGAVQVNRQRSKAAARVRKGDRIELLLPAPVPGTLEPEPADLRIVYEDEALLVVAKPAGMVVHPGAGSARGTLAAALLAHCGTLSQIGGVLRPGIVHRLDKGTSGLLAVAKDDQAHRSLSAQFKARTVTKIYAGICLGRPGASRGAIRERLGRDPRHRQRMAVVKGGREAHTEYEVTEALLGASVLRLTLHSGRTHQIRVHLASLHCPLVGDRVYGATTATARAPAPTRPLLQGFPRPALHAEILGFQHPRSGQSLRFEEPWPQDLVDLREALRSAGPP